MKSAQAQPSHTPNNHADDADEDGYEDRYYDRSFDHVARVRAAKEAAQRRMEEFGDVSEYDITIIHGQLKEEPEQNTEPSSNVEREGES